MEADKARWRKSACEVEHRRRSRSKIPAAFAARAGTVARRSVVSATSLTACRRDGRWWRKTHRLGLRRLALGSNSRCRGQWRDPGTRCPCAHFLNLRLHTGVGGVRYGFGHSGSDRFRVPILEDCAGDLNLFVPPTPGQFEGDLSPRRRSRRSGGMSCCYGCLPQRPLGVVQRKLGVHGSSLAGGPVVSDGKGHTGI